ncbi:MAG TPA: nodulation protein NfeD [Gammaproteobacteria bacterium]|nr:nodulation protein NfeD [Gammaproteobacteria bacterium]
MHHLAKWLLVIGMFCAALPVTASEVAVLLEIDGAIGPATSDFIERGIDKAEASGATLLVLRIDTPGGLSTAMRDIVQAILGSSIPVVGYVAPSGARAASAGTYILYASHIAAMAPGTNVGAATPVQIGGKGGLPSPGPPGPGEDQGKKDVPDNTGDAMKKKIVNDAAAYLRSLAQLRGRNEDWAEKAVRDGASLSAEEALAAGVIDMLARDMDDLLSRLNGYKITFKGDERVLNTENITLTRIEPGWRTRLLSVIADPNIAYILILIGIYGLIFEFYNPGFVLPGVVGAISLLLALFALQVLPVNYAGLGLLILGVIFMVSEAFVPSFGVLGIGGLVAFVIGSIILIDTDMPGYGISLPLIIAFSVISGAFFLGVIGMAIKARGRPVVSGQGELIDATGIVLQDFAEEGRIQIHGESWLAKANVPLKRGQSVQVTGIDGLTLNVKPKEED